MRWADGSRFATSASVFAGGAGRLLPVAFIAAACWAAPPIVGTTTGRVYHTCECPHAQRIHPQRRIVFADRAAAEKAGRTLCKTCARVELGAGPASSGPASTTASGQAAADRAQATRPASAAAASAAAETDVVRIVEVVDGFTLVAEGGKRVRLLGVRCPKPTHRVGVLARRFAEEQVYGRAVTLELDPLNAGRRHLDQWDRLLAYVRGTSDVEDLSGALIERGLGWCDDDARCTRREAYAALEQAARAARRGLWQPLPDPQGRAEVVVLPDDRAYHLPGCRHLRRAKELTTMTINDAHAAGRHPCTLFGGV